MIKPFGTLIDIDYNTRFRTNMNWAHVLVEVVDREVIPPYLWFEVNRCIGMKSNVKVCYTIEDDRMVVSASMLPKR